MDLKPVQKPSKRAIPQRPLSVANHSQGQRRPNRNSHRLLGRHRTRPLSRRSASGRRRRRDRCLLGRYAPGSSLRLRPNNLPDGCVVHGNTNGKYRRHCRGRPRSSRYSRYREGRARRLSAFALAIRYCGAAGHPGTIARIARENGTILRGNANFGSTADLADRMVSSQLKLGFVSVGAQHAAPAATCLGRAIWRGVSLMRPESTRTAAPGRSAANFLDNICFAI